MLSINICYFKKYKFKKFRFEIYNMKLELQLTNQLFIRLYITIIDNFIIVIFSIFTL